VPFNTALFDLHLDHSTTTSSRRGLPITVKTSMFHTVVQQGFWEAVRNVIILQIIHCCFQQWKNYQNRLTVDDVNAKSSTPHF